MGTRRSRPRAAGAKADFGFLDRSLLEDVDRAAGWEWLETDGLGGFASGAVNGLRTRRYHAVLLSALRPPTGRRVLVNGLEEQVEAGGDCVALSAHRYKPGVIYPSGHRLLDSFALQPWPTWRWVFSTGAGEEIAVRKELFMPRGNPFVAVRWTLEKGSNALLSVRPFLSGRDYHGIHLKNPDLVNAFEASGSTVSWQTYPDMPRVHAGHNGEYHHNPVWYDQFHYTIEQSRDLDAVEDLWAPGLFTFRLDAKKPAVVVFSTSVPPADPARAVAAWARTESKRRGRNVPVGEPERILERAAEAYRVKRGRGLTVVAGYPWFTDWGRDTFISMRGLCLATGRLKEAGSILVEWAKAVDGGMLPNRFPDEGESPEFNSVDASLWYVNVVGEYSAKTRYRDLPKLWPAIVAIMRGYRDGTRYGIGADADGLMRAGEPGSQLTWMDAKYEETCFSPRTGKPVEICALWLNAVAVLLALGKRVKGRNALPSAERKAWEKILKTGTASFRKRFWNEETRCLFDVVDTPQGDDPAIRPNQLFAVSLPLPLLDAARAKMVVAACESHLVTPLGLRTLAPSDPGYIGTYGGDRRTRDAAYHNGTVWPWLLGPFVEAWVKVRGGSAKAKKEARRFLAGVEAHLGEVGLGHVSEVASGDPPHATEGCPCQAWSVAEPLRLYKSVL